MPYSRNRARRKEYNRAYYLAHKAHIDAQNNSWVFANKDRRHLMYLRARAKLKAQGFIALGAVCVCCGFDDIRFLTMDHINGRNGARKTEPWCEAKRRGWNKAEFQILCGNCNLAKRDSGACPHQGQTTISQSPPANLQLVLALSAGAAEGT